MPRIAGPGGARNGPVAVLAALVLWMAAPAAALADFAQFGAFSFDRYQKASDATTGGVDIIAHYTLDAGFSDFADDFTEGDLRWLQLVTTSKDSSFTPTPNRPFIDPRSDQPGGFDDLPWYDPTFTTLANAQANTNRQFGSGPYYLDTPRALLSRGPYTFTAQTLLVVEEGQRIGVLGGFQWGFTIGADRTTVTPLDISLLTDSPSLLEQVNAALGLDFPGYTLEGLGQLFPGPDVTPPIPTVPEPSSVILVAVGAACLVPLARARRRPAA
jgi:hypothetical protein